MSAYRKTLVLMVVLGLGGAAWAEIDVVAEVEVIEAEPVELEETAVVVEEAPAFPYLGTISGDNVNIRSGQAEIYPPVGKLDKGRQVIVKQELFNRWAQVYPTKECYSYIAKQYVELRDFAGPVAEAAVETIEVAEETTVEEIAVEEVAAVDPTAGTEAPTIVMEPVAPIGKAMVMGLVTGNNVRVRAGAVIAPAYCDEVQRKLNKGDVVTIIGQRDDYYKIVCPPDCYFYVSLDYIKREGPASDELIANMQAEIGGAVLKRQTPEVVVAVEPAGPVLSEREQYDAAVGELQAELGKPLAERSFVGICGRLDKLYNETASESMKVRADVVRRQVDRCQIAVDAFRESQQQDERLQMALNDIEQKSQRVVAVNQPPKETAGDLVLQGRLARSTVFNKPGMDQRFVVLDDDDKIIYYAVADRAGLDLSEWLSKKVSMVGQARYDAFANVRVLDVSNLVEVPQVVGE